MHRSEKILRGIDNQYYRATYKSMGFTTAFTGPAVRRWSSA